jgi:hypothetical protein
VEGGYALAGAGEGDTGSQLSISLTPGHNAAPSKGHFLAPGTRAWPCSAAWTHLPELDTELLLRLQQPVTPEWINGLRIMGSYEYILGRGQSVSPLALILLASQQTREMHSRSSTTSSSGFRRRIVNTGK